MALGEFPSPDGAWIVTRDSGQIEQDADVFPSPDGAWIVTPPLLYPETMRVVKAKSANLIKIIHLLLSF